MCHPDHEAITRTVYEYAYGLDGREWGRYRRIFADEIAVDFSSYNGRPRTSMTADEWVAGLRPLFTGLDATQHSMSNPLVDVEGETARCRMYVQAAHFLDSWPEPEFTIGGYYDDRLVHNGDGWRIAAVTLIVRWRRGDPDLMVEAARRGAERPGAGT